MTLIEIMIVVVIIGILAGLALPRYNNAVEKGRSSEARYILGVIRQAEDAYYLDQGAYGLFNNLNLSYPSSCNASYFFHYLLTPSVGADGHIAGYVVTADRCTSGGKPPQALSAYVINMTETGAIGGDKGFL